MILGHLLYHWLCQARDKLIKALSTEPWGQDVYLLGGGLKSDSSHCFASSALWVCLSDLDPKDPTVHSCALPNPECLTVCHAHYSPGALRVRSLTWKLC